ncbi:hypothetical protein MKX01_006541 [Papaver californicum]|nr:hypothetical protein MKX01_006541 [Papaver californicum]
MIKYVMALEAALLPCLPARELQATTSFLSKGMQEISWKLPKSFNFIGLQHEELPTREEILRKEIARMEKEVTSKSDLIKKHKKLILGWRKELKDQLDKHNKELEKV